MNHNHPDNPIEPLDLVDSAFAEIRNQAIPAGPPLDLFSRTRDALRASSAATLAPRRAGPYARFTGMGIVARVAASFLLAAGVCAFVFAMLRAPAVTCADVLMKVCRAHTLSVDIDTTGAHRAAVHTAMTMSDQGQIRQEIPGGRSVVDIKANRFLVLMNQPKTAMVMSLTESAPTEQQFNILDSFQKLTASPSSDLGEETINGRDARKFAIEKDGEKLTIWADAQSGDPIRVQTIDEHGAKVIFSNFVLNPQLPQDYFSADIPEGYNVHQMQQSAFDFKLAGKRFVTSLRGYTQVDMRGYSPAFNSALVVFFSKGF